MTEENKDLELSNEDADNVEGGNTAAPADDFRRIFRDVDADLDA